MEDVHSSNGWDRIGGIRSASSPATWYNIGLRTSGYLGCSCRSWIYKQGVKPFEGFENTCKHIRDLLSEKIAMTDLDLTTFGLTWLGKRTAAKRQKQLAKVG